MIIEDAICKLDTESHLTVKRYLSQTRNYYREGSWIREYFLPYFPLPSSDENGNIFFDLRTVEPAYDSTYSTLSSSKIPFDTFKAFEEAFGKFNSKLQKKDLSFNEEISSNEFTLPDPRVHPEIYIIAKDNIGVRLIILWGLESKKPRADLPMSEVVEILRDQFIGKSGIKLHKAKSRATPKKAAKVKNKVVKEKKQKPLKEEKPKPAPKQEKVKPAPKKEKTKPAPKQEKVKPAPKKEKAKPAPKQKKVKVKKKPKPKKPRKPKKKFNWARLKWLRNLMLLIIALCAGFYGVGLASQKYLGVSLSAEAQATKTDRAIQLSDKEGLLLYDNQFIPSNGKKKTVYVGSFPKTGKYPFIKRMSQLTSSKDELVTMTYNNMRNDLQHSPVASLYLEKKELVSGDTLSIKVNHSYHEEGESLAMDYYIHWGDSQNEFQKLNNIEDLITHQYDKTGIHKVTLMVKDSYSKWDYDTEEIHVAAHQNELKNNIHQTPVADVEIASIVEQEKGYSVTVDFSQSYGLDAKIQDVLINWGDRTKPETIDFKKKNASHLYKKRSKKSAIQAFAIDEKEIKSYKPAILNLDFQSSQMNNLGRFTPKEAIKYNEKILKDKANGIQIIQRILKPLNTNKQTIVFIIGYPLTQTKTALYDIKWKVTGADDNDFVINDTKSIVINAVEGKYKVWVSAKSINGETYELENDFSVYLKDQYPIHVRAAIWFSDMFNNLSLSLN